LALLPAGPKPNLDMRFSNNYQEVDDIYLTNAFFFKLIHLMIISSFQVKTAHTFQQVEKTSGALTMK
jgi:hypothetical protein